MASEEPVLSAMMSKRAQGRSALGRLTWKDRFFVLMPSELSYWEGFGGHTNPGAKKKDGIPISDIVAVEEVPQKAFGRPFMVQVVRADATLYAQCQSLKDQKEWLAELRKLVAKNSNLAATYHPSHFDGKWMCCQTKDKKAAGCQPCFDYGPLGGASRAMSVSRQATDPLPKPVAADASSAAPLSASASSSSIQAQPLPPLPGAAPAEPVAPPKPSLFVVVVTFEYKALEPHDLSIVPGEKLDVLDDSEDHWWKARNAQGKEGMIPCNYVRREGLESEVWFRGRISRSEAGALLRMEKQEGCFLVRESESTPGTYSLSVSHKEGVRHYHIRHVEGEYYVSERHRFHSILELINYHKHNSGGLVTRLRIALDDKSEPITAGLGHDKWELDPKDIQFIKTLGSGQFGVVKEGLYKGQLPVAVKMMKEGSMPEEDFVAEAQVMKSFRHKNLVELHGVCTSVRPIYIVTELMCNGCLLDYLRENPKMIDSPEILHYMSVQVASAMVFLEEHGFIHRDLAARNCLVGENNVVKVADFGLARFTLDDEYTASEGTKFPIKWAAPEVFNYARFSTKSDVWSFGILLWEIWSMGCMPYPTMTNAMVIDRVAKGYRMDRPDRCPEHVYQIMQECWHQDVEGRPPFVDVLQSLEENKGAYTDSM
eukprot:m.10570 g.10570  ORF g.10570 m.10570 type:complete len:654 (+) comp5587_c0_seq1:251-2212(+)